VCGIIGYLGEKQAKEILVDGLKALEYRGYDSAGVATVDADNHLKWAKKAGSVGNLEKHLSEIDSVSTIGVAHTRWATHGGVNDLNAHPHLSCKGDIAVVHNGIIENFQELRKELEEKGHKFKSDCDSEVIAHLIEENCKDGKSVEKAILDSLKKLKGAFAIAVLSSIDRDLVVAARREAPLLVGIAEHGVLIASDPQPIAKHTKRVVFLEEDDVVVAKRSGSSFLVNYYNSGSRVNRQEVELHDNFEAAEKGKFEHFMLKEIMEQPIALRNATVQDKEFFESFASDLAKAKKLFLIACGTAGYAALEGRYLFSSIAGKNSQTFMAYEFPYLANECDKDTLVLAISQSGETADLLNALKEARKRGARVYSVVNVVGSTLSRVSDKTIYLNCGPEVAVASTKAFMNQLAVIYMLAYATSGRYEVGVKKIREASKLVKETIELNEGKVSSLARIISKKDSAYFIGRGINYPIALEGALKMKEISYIHAEGMPAGELKHGTIALIETGTPVIVVNPTGSTHAETLSNAIETKARGAMVIGVSDEENPEYAHWIQVPKCEPELFSIVCLPALQLLAYRCAVERGKNPDRPRNLAKSVTVK
jgi:glucosamine--fructose-6-phosphate aminotransferase (isomerizing)